LQGCSTHVSEAAACPNDAFVIAPFSQHSGGSGLIVRGGVNMENTVMLTKHILPIAMAAGTLMLSSVGSQALPTAKPSAVPIPIQSGGPIETVGWRCGPAWHMNRWGNCVPNHRVMMRPVGHWHAGFWFRHRWHPGYWGF